MASRKKISDLDALEWAAESRGQLDDHRLTELKNERRLQEIKEISRRKERDRLIKKYGATHPRVQKLQTRIKYNEDMFVALETEIKRTENKTEPLPEKGWRLDGKLLDQKNNPVANATVFFANSKKVWLREFGSSLTDKSGNFSLPIEEIHIEEAKKAGLHLAASIKEKELIYFDTAVQKPQQGAVDFQIINLQEK